MPGVFFGVQLAVRMPQGDALRLELEEAVRALRGCTTVPLLRAGWTRASGLLLEAPPATLGTWDLIREDGEATYEEWASGLEAMEGWPAADFGDGDLVLLSAIFLVAAGSNADTALGDACDLPERDWLRQSTYRTLLGLPPKLNCTGVLGSGLYVAPRSDLPGFSVDVLRGEGFGYLEPVR